MTGSVAPPVRCQAIERQSLPPPRSPIPVPPQTARPYRECRAAEGLAPYEPALARRDVTPGSVQAPREPAPGIGLDVGPGGTAITVARDNTVGSS